MIDSPRQSFDPTTEIAEVGAATQRLVDTATKLTDAAAHEPSLLPDWTRGHVLTHVARNADALGNLLEWARTGHQNPMYPSVEARNADIATGATRSIAELVDDLRESAGRLAVAAGQLPPDSWSSHVRVGPGAAGREVPASEVLWLRRKEVEIHHVDLGAGYTPAHWPAAFVGRALAETCRMFSSRDGIVPFAVAATDTGASFVVGDAIAKSTVRGSQAALLAWLTGRSNGDGLVIDPAAALPPIPAWA